MRLTILLPNSDIKPLEVADNSSVSEMLSVLSALIKIPSDTFALLKYGEAIANTESSLESAGICDGDLLEVVPKQERVRPEPSRNTASIPILDFSTISVPSQQSRSTTSETERARQFILSAPPHQMAFIRERNPQLADAVNNAERFAVVYNSQRRLSLEHAMELQRLSQTDQMDPAVQARIAELIQQRNIDMEMERALEYYPETFGQVSMLFVNCKVKGHSIKAFVDSGAQTTIMSDACARRCNLENLIDKRWAGMAHGIGTQTIIGRVHNGQIEISGVFIPTSFVVLQNQELDLLIGLDMLKRHQCCVDLKRNVLMIGDKVEAPFLPESEIPKSMFEHSGASDAESAATHSGTHGADSTSNMILSDDQETKVIQLVSQGFPRDKAISQLMLHNWDVDAAIVGCLSNSDVNSSA